MGETTREKNEGVTGVRIDRVLAIPADYAPSFSPVSALRHIQVLSDVTMCRVL